MQHMRHIILTSFCLLLISGNGALSEENCFYTDDSGLFVSTNSKEDVPEQYKSAASCNKVRSRSTERSNSYQAVNSAEPPRMRVRKTKSRKRNYLRPSEIELGRSKRRRSLQTPLGVVAFSWEASAEKYFGKAAEQTVLSAMRASARVLAQNSFPPELRDNYDWEIVIMDSVPPEADISLNGKSVCHPGWMRPPAQIYLAAERIATGCGRKKLSTRDAVIQLEETLVHEIGHAVEYKMLGGYYRQHERWHKEGFATWFESLASNYISSRGANKAKMKRRVQKSWDDSWNPSAFSGSWQDYSRGYAIISTIAEKRTIRRLQQIYQRAANNHIPMSVAIEQDLHWDRDKIFKNVKHSFEIR